MLCYHIFIGNHAKKIIIIIAAAVDERWWWDDLVYYFERETHIVPFLQRGNPSISICLYCTALFSANDNYQAHTCSPANKSSTIIKFRFALTRLELIVGRTPHT